MPQRQQALLEKPLFSSAYGAEKQVLSWAPLGWITLLPP
jgi:hypothetical protein